MTATPVPAEQLALLRKRVRARRPAPVSAPAAELSVARVAVDLPLAHLDRPFDYLVPASLHEETVPGCRVKVRFSGRDVDGFVIERADDTDHVGALTPLRRVVSSEPVLTPAVLAVARMVADRYAGTLADVLRLAVPPRHARVEAETPRARVLEAPADAQADRWREETGGGAMLSRLRSGESPRAVWTALAGAAWPEQLAAAAAATLTSGRGTIICVPDARDVARVDEALTSVLGGDACVVLTADLGPAARYRAFLALARGQVQVVVGTRAAAFAPVRDLGLVVMWDDGDDLYAEPRAPYPHAREVLLLRAHQERTAALFGAISRSVEAQALVESSWAVSLTASRAVARAKAPQVHVTGEHDSEQARDTPRAAGRMPRRVFEIVREALSTGPVLVHTPRYGYQPALTCDSCRHAAHCERCNGPLSRPLRAAPPQCRWCGLVAPSWVCRHCQGQRLRAPVVGSLRTAEEWGRSFPQTKVVSSGGDHVLDAVASEPAIVVATAGAEPRADGGFSAAVLLDTWLMLSRPDLRAGEEALRRWFHVAALVRPAADGGRVLAVGDPTSAALQALVRWDSEGFASRELCERRSAHLTPAARMATVTGPPDVIADVLTSLTLPRDVEVLGPVEVGEQQARIVVRTPHEHAAGLAKALSQLQAGRSSRKRTPVRVQVDPGELI